MFYDNSGPHRTAVLVKHSLSRSATTVKHHSHLYAYPFSLDSSLLRTHCHLSDNITREVLLSRSRLLSINVTVFVSPVGDFNAGLVCG